MIHITVTRPGVTEREATVEDTFDLLDFAENSIRALAPELTADEATAIDEHLADAEKQRAWAFSASASLIIGDPELVISWRDYSHAPAAMPAAA